MNRLRWLWMSLFTGLLSIAVIAQGADCPTIVTTALDSLDAVCAETGRNQACYGNVLIDMQQQGDTEAVPFQAPGDTVNLSDVATMKLAPLNEEANTWGVAMMKLQANIPNTNPGQNVTFLMFGDVEIDNAVTEDDSDFTPMQAFYFSSGVGDAGCEEAPESGLLIQTPEGVEEVLLNVNGANMSLGSTAFLQAGVNRDNEDEFELAISVLEGQGVIEAYGEVSPIPAGSWIRLRTDRNLNVIAPPDNPVPYKFDRHNILPIGLLEREFEIADSLTQEELDEKIADFTPRQAMLRLREQGSRFDVGTTQQVIKNELDENVVVYFSESLFVTVPANSEKTVDVPRGKYTVEICATSCVVIEDAIIRRDRERIITEDTFSQ